MVNHLTESIVRFFVGNKIIPEEEIEAYSYGYEIMFISIINWGIILAIMLVTGKVYETLLYIFSIITLRHHTGGYHASTHLRCSVLSISMYVVFLVIIFVLLGISEWWMPLLVTVFSNILIFKLAPIVHKNNPICEKMLVRHKLYSRVLSVLFSIAVIIFLFFEYMELSLSISLGLFQVSVCLLIEYLTQEERRISV